MDEDDDELPSSASGDAEIDGGGTVHGDDAGLERGDPDVLLEVPSLRVGELDLDVSNLHAHVALQARVADLVTLQAGTDVTIGNVELNLKEVEAQAILKVRLREVYKIVERSLASIDRNPELVAIRGRAPDAMDRSTHRVDADTAAFASPAIAEPVVAEEPPPAEPAVGSAETAPALEGPARMLRGERAMEEPLRRRGRRSLTARVLHRAVRTPRTILRRAREVADRLRGGVDES